MKPKLKIAQFGLGPIGLECLKLLATKDWATVVGAVDVDPAKAAKDLEELTETRGFRGLRVVRSVKELEQKPDLIFHTAVSRFQKANDQLQPLIRKGINIVSSCEEMLFPHLRYPKASIQLDSLCRKAGARIVGTGVNPGFVMDLLPLCLASASTNIMAIHVERVVNASTRREPLQRKIGSGLPPAEFQRLLRSGKAGHAGLKESLALVAHAFGHKLNKIKETAHAIIAEKDIQTSILEVRKGQTCGLHQHVEARLKGNLCITLDLKMYLEAPEPYDAVHIEGNPPLDVMIRGGVAGDQATVAALVNTAPRLMRAQPGLSLLTELPVA